MGWSTHISLLPDHGCHVDATTNSRLRDLLALTDYTLNYKPRYSASKVAFGSVYGTLNEKCPPPPPTQAFKHWSLISSAVWGGLTFLEEASYWEGALEFITHITSSFLSLLHPEVEDESSQLPAPASMPIACCHASLPWYILFFFLISDYNLMTAFFSSCSSIQPSIPP